MLLVPKSTGLTYRHTRTFHSVAQMKKPCLVAQLDLHYVAQVNRPCLAAQLDLSLCCPDQETLLNGTTGLVTVLLKSIDLA